MMVQVFVLLLWSGVPSNSATVVGDFATAEHCEAAYKQVQRADLSSTMAMSAVNRHACLPVVRWRPATRSPLDAMRGSE